MSWFTKSATVERVPQEPAEDSLTTIERTYRQAERDFTDAAFEVAQYNATHKDLRIISLNGERGVLVGAMTRFPERQRLEGIRDAAFRKRNELLKQRAELLMAQGRVK